MNTVYRSPKDYAEKPTRPMSEKLAKDIEAGKRLGFGWCAPVEASIELHCLKVQVLTGKKGTGDF